MEIKSFESEMVDELRKRARDSLLVDAIVTDRKRIYRWKIIKC